MRYQENIKTALSPSLSAIILSVKWSESPIKRQIGQMDKTTWSNYMPSIRESHSKNERKNDWKRNEQNLTEDQVHAYKCKKNPRRSKRKRGRQKYF